MEKVGCPKNLATYEEAKRVRELLKIAGFTTRGKYFCSDTLRVIQPETKP